MTLQQKLWAKKQFLPLIFFKAQMNIEPFDQAQDIHLLNKFLQ